MNNCICMQQYVGMRRAICVAPLTNFHDVAVIEKSYLRCSCVENPDASCILVLNEFLSCFRRSRSSRISFTCSSCCWWTPSVFNASLLGDLRTAFWTYRDNRDLQIYKCTTLRLRTKAYHFDFKVNHVDFGFHSNSHSTPFNTIVNHLVSFNLSLIQSIKGEREGGKKGGREVGMTGFVEDEKVLKADEWAEEFLMGWDLERKSCGGGDK